MQITQLLLASCLLGGSAADFIVKTAPGAKNFGGPKKSSRDLVHHISRQTQAFDKARLDYQPLQALLIPSL